jgi:hypothetical protein
MKKTHAVDRYMGLIAEMEAWDRRHVTMEVQAYDTFKKE